MSASSETLVKQWTSTKKIKRWIQVMVRIEPTIMRRVLKAEFGDLDMWIDEGAFEFGQCGCLIGTTALCLAADRNTYKPRLAYMGDSAWIRSDGRPGQLGSCQVVRKLVKTANPELKARMSKLTTDAGYAASTLKSELDNAGYAELAQDEAVRLIKSWIRAEFRAKAKRRRACARA